MQTYFTIFVNGEPFNCCDSMSLQNVLWYLNFEISNIVVEYNNEIIDRNEFSSLFLRNEDRIEIITIVGGG
uniref:Thiamin biosynthesis protein S n=1 Tax=Kuetzingia canaliculata TaxID=228262 RepID=A0A1Z1MPE8_KUECA|nr:thiamin biosynthesis protein S [Kuetzingia canaliculata]ARW67967.1 thiamin biosynthesis protein S [Kuetzingia canaliculata]